MKIKCIEVEVGKLGSNESEHVSEYVHLDEIGLELGRIYSVYGITFRSGVPWFYICEEDGDDYPIPHYGGFFHIVEPVVSSNWKFYFSPNQTKLVAVLPARWGDDPLFYERLVNGSEVEISEFRQIRKVIDLETSV